MKKRGLVLALMLGSTLALASCGDEEKDVAISDDEISGYVDASKEISEAVYSNQSFDQLSMVFERKKEDIDSKLYAKRFDLSKLEVQNMYDTDAKITDTSLEDVVVETEASTGDVRIVTVYKVDYVLDHEEDTETARDYQDGHSHPKSVMQDSITDIYTFNSGKLTGYKSFR